MNIDIEKKLLLELNKREMIVLKEYLNYVVIEHPDMLYDYPETYELFSTLHSALDGEL